jgi:hypothetical protein
VRTIHVVQEAGADKTLRVTIPVDQAGRRYQVVIILEAEPDASSRPSAETPDWSPGYFEKTASSVQDDTFVRPPQGEYETRQEFDGCP